MQPMTGFSKRSRSTSRSAPASGSIRAGSTCGLTCRARRRERFSGSSCGSWSANAGKSTLEMSAARDGATIEGRTAMSNIARRPRASGLRGLALLSICTALVALPGASRSQGTDEWKVDPIRGPVDLGLTDPALVGAIDIHLHVDPDSATGGPVRAMDVFDAARLAMSRGMRGFVYKTHQDAGSAAGAYMVRKHVSATFDIYGRMASNYATGGI